MSTIFDNEVLIHHIAAPGLPGDGFTAPEAASLRADMNTMLARPVVENIGDLGDVTVTAPTAGQMLVFDGSGNLANSDVARGLDKIQRSGSNLASDITILNFNAAMNITWPGGGVANIFPVWGGTGIADSFAHSDHTHQMFTDREFAISASGTLSGGTRSLVNSTVTGLDPARTYVIKGKLFLHLRGDGTGASFARPRMAINSIGKDIFEDSRIVAGVLVTEVAVHAGTSVTGVSSIPVTASVAFQPGDPVYVGGGLLVIEIEANR